MLSPSARFFPRAHHSSTVLLFVFLSIFFIISLLHPSPVHAINLQSEATVLAAMDANGDGNVNITEYRDYLATTGVGDLPGDDQLFKNLTHGEKNFFTLQDLRADSVTFGKLEERIEYGQAITPFCPNMPPLNEFGNVTVLRQAIAQYCGAKFKVLETLILAQPITDTYVWENKTTKRPLVDIVMEGGGTLGVALAGFTWGLEQVGVRFRSVAGASAGAVNAAFLAASGPIATARTHRALPALEENFIDAFIEGHGTCTGKYPDIASWLKKVLSLGYLKGWFLSQFLPEIKGTYNCTEALEYFSRSDWPSKLQRLAKQPNAGDHNLPPAQQFLQDEGATWYTLSRILIDHVGLFNSSGFATWFNDRLAAVDGCQTVGALANSQRCMALKPEDIVFARRSGSCVLEEQPSDSYRKWVLDPELVVVTTDITTQSRVFLPRHGPVYFRNLSAVTLGQLVRASMSVPLYFKPMHVDNLPCGSNSSVPVLASNAEQAQCRQIWTDGVHGLGYHGYLPSEVDFVDGGVLSNFPMDALYLDTLEVPWLPSIGVRLGDHVFTPSANDLDLASLLTSMFSAARRMYDREFLLNNAPLNKLVTNIEVPQFISREWLDFGLSDEHKMLLFAAGARHSLHFLETFNWERYKKLRAMQARSMLEILSDEEQTPVANVSMRLVNNTLANMQLVRQGGVQ